MQAWDLNTVDVQPHKPVILASNEGRAIIVNLPAGESMPDHQVHEHAWVTVISGDVTISPVGDGAGEPARAGAGSLVHFDPSERHRVDAHANSRLLLLLAPWPGEGHPGETPADVKREASKRAAAINGR